jgi:ribosomal subunit interface protein
MDVTPALDVYIESKLEPLGKLLKNFERDGELELHLEVSRTTQHHHKGDEVFLAIANLELPRKMLRAEASASDIHKAIDELRGMLHLEVEKYKSKHADAKRGGK